MAYGNKTSGISWSGLQKNQSGSNSQFHWLNKVYVAKSNLFEEIKASWVVQSGNWVKWYDPVFAVAFFADKAASDGTPGSISGNVPKWNVPVGTKRFMLDYSGLVENIHPLSSETNPRWTWWVHRHTSQDK